jgi:hypothetical protein
LGDKQFPATGQKKQQTHSDTHEENAKPFQRMQFADEHSHTRHPSKLKFQRTWVNAFEGAK